MSPDITLNQEVFKALAGETRILVLKSLLERRKIQSELSKELNLSPPTIKEHVDILLKAGLVREVGDGHKWKYIELTVKGKALLQPQDNRILVLLGTSLLGVAVTSYLAYVRFFGNANDFFSNSLEAETMLAKSASVVSESAGGVLENTVMDAPADTALHAGELIANGAFYIPWGELFVMGFCLVVLGISIGMWIKKTY
ncbi:MAG: winged helix-turn-helix domain-containing protein [Candidatus Diapherotrites archaeon]